MPYRFFQINNTGKTLAAQLADSGCALDTRCGGHGTCGRCEVTLYDGQWAVSGKPVRVPCKALACRATLLTPRGSVLVPESSLLSSALNGKGLSQWRSRPIPPSRGLAVGFDIGTTTLAAAAFLDGEPLGSVSQSNPQAMFGDNVMARISAMADDGPAMRSCLLEAMKEMLARLSLPRSVDHIAIAGNSTMTCIFHGVDPSSMGTHPFTVPQRIFEPISASCLGLPDTVTLATAPLATAFIGGDIVAGLGEVELKPGEMFIDLGTNCEMVLKLSDGRLLGTAAAAGPAFEGVGIRCGSRAAWGVVSAYRSTDDYDILDSGPPRGFCGSALVDVLAVLRINGTLSEFGRFQPPAPTVEPVPGLPLSEKDVETLITAKAAIAAGIKILSRHGSIPVTKLILAGGFAEYLNMENARIIGLIPDLPVAIAGNTSLAGATRLACTPDTARELEKIQVESFNLNDDPDFENDFINAMRLPQKQPRTE